MKINTFWKIIIKSIGLWLLINCVWIIPQFSSTLNFVDDEVNWKSLLVVWLISFVTLAVFLLVTRLFLFKTDWIVNTLKLDKNFDEDKIDMQLPAKTVLSITVTIIGAIWFLKSLPDLVSSIFEFLQQKELIANYAETGWLIYFFVTTITGFLVMTNGKYITNYIWKENSEK